MACCQHQRNHHQERTWDPRLDQDPERLVLEKLIPIHVRDGLVNRVHARECTEANPDRLGRDHLERVLPYLEFLLTSRPRCQDLAQYAFAAQGEGHAGDKQKPNQRRDEPAPPFWLTIVGARHQHEPCDRPCAQRQHRPARQCGQRPCHQNRRNDLPHDVFVTGRPGVGKRQGHERGQFQQLGLMVPVDKRADEQPSPVAGQSVDLALRYHSVAETDNQHRHARCRNQEWHRKAKSSAGGEHQGRKGHAGYRPGLGELHMGRWRI